MITNLTMIVAYGQNNEIGNNGDMPWGRGLKDDLRNFQDLTTGNTIIMGRKTYESIGKPLPGRKTIVLSRNPSLAIEGVQVASDIRLLLPEDIEGQAFVVGGSQIYSAALPFVDRIIATEVQASFDADTYISLIEKSIWQERQSTMYRKSDKNAYDFRIVEYTRTKTDARLLFVDPAKTRSEDQLNEYLRISADEVCPFCIESRDEYTQGERLFEGGHWWIFANNWPYKGCQFHAMIVSRAHGIYIEDLPSAAGKELFAQIAALQDKHNIPYAALAARFGFVHRTGASVAHFHAHLISPEEPTTYTEMHDVDRLVFSSEYWDVHTVKSPDKTALYQRSIVSRQKAENISDLDQEAGSDLLAVMQRLEDEAGMSHGGFIGRFGKRQHDGQTAERIVFEFVSPAKLDTNDSHAKFRYTISDQPNTSFKISP